MRYYAPQKINLDHFFTCHGCKPGRHFLSSCSEVNSIGYLEFDEPISAHLQRYPLFEYILIYNIASRATQSNSVYVSVLQISTEHADGVSKSLCQKFFSRERPLSAQGKILYFATMMDTETRPTSPQTNTIFRPFLVG